MEDEDRGGYNSIDPELTGHGYKHLTETERITLVNLIKTLDEEDVIKMKFACRDPEVRETRKLLWAKIASAFNEICGKTCDAVKLRQALNRIKRNTVNTKAHSLFYDEHDDKHTICPLKTE